MDETKTEPLKEFDKKTRLHLLNLSKIPKQYLRYKWSDYCHDTLSGRIIHDDTVVLSRRTAKQRCIKYCSDLNSRVENGKSLLIEGRSGSGKSVLGILILKEVIRQLMINVSYVDFAQLSLEASTVHLEDEREFFERRYRTPEWLMIDEINTSDVMFGKNKYKDNKTQEYITNILHRRYSDRKPTILTTNLQSNQLQEAIGSRAYSIVNKQNDKIYEHIRIEVESNSMINNQVISYDLNKIMQLVKNQIEIGNISIDHNKMMTILKGAI